jgi:hypothetical protein
METGLSIVAMLVLIGAASSAGGKLLVRKRGALWIWDRSNLIGWPLLVVGSLLILAGMFLESAGAGMNAKLAFGSLLALAGLWLIWF